jgi:hypothetical protein
LRPLTPLSTLGEKLETRTFPRSFVSHLQIFSDPLCVKNQGYHAIISQILGSL